MHGFNSMYTSPGVMAHLFVIAQNQQDEAGKEKCGWRLRRKRLGESGAADRPKPPASGATRFPSAWGRHEHHLLTAMSSSCKKNKKKNGPNS